MPSPQNNAPRQSTASDDYDVVNRIASRPPLKGESVARDTRDTCLDCLVIKMAGWRKKDGDTLTDAETWAAIHKLSEIIKGGVEDSEFDALERWWDDELARMWPGGYFEASAPRSR